MGDKWDRSGELEGQVHEFPWLMSKMDEMAEDYNRLSEKYRDLWHKQWKVENALFLSFALNIILSIVLISRL